MQSQLSEVGGEANPLLLGRESRAGERFVRELPLTAVLTFAIAPVVVVSCVWISSSEKALAGNGVADSLRVVTKRKSDS